MKIHYITQWGENTIGRTLTYSPAAITKMKFLVGSIMEDYVDKVCISSFSIGEEEVSTEYIYRRKLSVAQSRKFTTALLGGGK